MAEARILYPAEPIQDILNCSICMERYNTSSHHPKQLPCNHTLCLQCLQYLDGRDLQGKVKCSECRLNHDVPSGGVRHFGNNYTIMSLLDIMPVAQQSTKASPHKADASRHSKTPTSMVKARLLSLSNKKERTPPSIRCPPDETRVVRLAGVHIKSQTMIDFKIENGKVTKTNIAPLPEGIRIYRGSGRVQIGKELFLFGGSHKDGERKVRHNDVYKHNVGRMQWSKLKAMLRVVRNVAAFSLDNQTIYLAGGSDGHLLATVSVYNTIRDTHTTLSDMCIAVQAPAATVYNGTAYLSGGYCGTRTNETSRDIYQYNKEQDSWFKVGTMQHARYYHALVEDQGLLYNVGGVLGDERTPVLSIDIFNPATKQSTLLSTSLPGKLIRGGWVYMEGFLYFTVLESKLLYRLELSTGKMTALHGDIVRCDYLMTV